jgi:outer membrane lipoprotein-sorting protein
MRISKWILPALCLTAVVHAQDAPKPPEAPAGARAKEILKTTLDVYAGAKTYQGMWSYTTERGAAKSLVNMEIKAKSPSRLYFKVSPAPNQKPAPGQEPVPELLVVLDGKTAYFQNATANVYYKIPLPKVALISPLMFMPQIPAASQVELKESKLADGKPLHVLEAATIEGASTRMEIAAENMRIRRIVSEKTIGPLKETALIVVEKEVFNGEIPEGEFKFKALKGAKEIPAPPGTEALFGPPAG